MSYVNSISASTVHFCTGRNRISVAKRELVTFYHSKLWTKKGSGMRIVHTAENRHFMPSSAPRAHTNARAMQDRFY
jgi:hypothetical protein